LNIKTERGHQPQGKNEFYTGGGGVKLSGSPDVYLAFELMSKGGGRDVSQRKANGYNFPAIIKWKGINVKRKKKCQRK